MRMKLFSLFNSCVTDKAAFLNTQILNQTFIATS